MKALNALLILALLPVSVAVSVPTWSGVSGGENVAILGDRVQWGTGATSALEWLRIDSGASPGQPYIMGELTHFNETIAIGSGITGVDLNTHGLTFHLIFDETINTGPTPDDVVAFPATYPAGVIGFGPDPGNILPYLSTPEWEHNSTYLWGPKPIPAPGALVLAMIGTVLARRRCLWQSEKA